MTKEEMVEYAIKFFGRRLRDPVLRYGERQAINIAIDVLREREDLHNRLDENIGAAKMWCRRYHELLEKTSEQVVASNQQVTEVLRHNGFSDYEPSFAIEDQVNTVCINRGGQDKYIVRIMPLRESDMELARKKATEKCGKAVNMSVFKNWIIYLSTIEEDRTELWRDPKNIDTMLTPGEKHCLLDVIMEISGLNEPEG